MHRSDFPILIPIPELGVLAVAKFVLILLYVYHFLKAPCGVFFVNKHVYIYIQCFSPQQIVCILEV